MTDFADGIARPIVGTMFIDEGAEGGRASLVPESYATLVSY